MSRKGQGSDRWEAFGMRSKLMVATAVPPLVWVLQRRGLPLSSKPLSAKDAKEFVAKAEAELAGQSEYLNRAGWIQATYINYNSNWLVAKATAENTSVSMRYAKEAARFDQVKVDPDTRRKLDILKRQLVLPVLLARAKVEPLYSKLHCYVRAKLNAKYGAEVQPATGPIRADLTGNMWGQDWGNIYDIVAPQDATLPVTT